MDNLVALCSKSVQTDQEMHLFLCPFAGGSSGAFRLWRELVGPEISLAVYPGHDQRMRQSCMTSIEDLAGEVQKAIVQMHSSVHRLIIVGHSMGAQVAYEVCRRLEGMQLMPRGLVLSACHAPHLRGRHPIGHLDDREFLEQLVAMGGCPSELLQDKSLWPVFMPMLRADFKATESYWYSQKPRSLDRLKTPSLLFFGTQDMEASKEEVGAWNEWLRDVHGPVSIAGDHFYITRRPRAVLEYIRHFFETNGAPLS